MSLLRPTLDYEYVSSATPRSFAEVESTPLLPLLQLALKTNPTNRTIILHNGERFPDWWYSIILGLFSLDAVQVFNQREKRSDLLELREGVAKTLVQSSTGIT